MASKKTTDAKSANRRGRASGSPRAGKPTRSGRSTAASAASPSKTKSKTASKAPSNSRRSSAAKKKADAAKKKAGLARGASSPKKAASKRTAAQRQRASSNKTVSLATRPKKKAARAGKTGSTIEKTSAGQVTSARQADGSGKVKRKATSTGRGRASAGGRPTSNAKQVSDVQASQVQTRRHRKLSRNEKAIRSAAASAKVKQKKAGTRTDRQKAGPIVRGDESRTSRRGGGGQEVTLPKTRLTAKQLQFFKEMLLAKRRELVGDVRALTKDALGMSRQDSTGDLSCMPIHMADLGTDNWEQDFTIGLIANEQRLVREIDDALARIDEGTYGICLATYKPISIARLKAKPWAKWCIEYARQRELGRY